MEVCKYKALLTKNTSFSCPVPNGHKWKWHFCRSCVLYDHSMFCSFQLCVSHARVSYGAPWHTALVGLAASWSLHLLFRGYSCSNLTLHTDRAAMLYLTQCHHANPTLWSFLSCLYVLTTCSLAYQGTHVLAYTPDLFPYNLWSILPGYLCPMFSSLLQTFILIVGDPSYLGTCALCPFPYFRCVPL